MNTPDAARDVAIRSALRSATRALHDEVDAAMARLDWQTRAGMGRMLSVHLDVIPSAEQAISRSPLPEELGDWEQRTRAGALRDDMAQLGFALPQTDRPAHPWERRDPVERAYALGLLYTLEGSRVGGRYIASELRNSSEIGDVPITFLDGPEDAALWRSFRVWLSEQVLSEAELALACEAARDMFESYKRVLAMPVHARRPAADHA